jgi:hypothetical protein
VPTMSSVARARCWTPAPRLASRYSSIWERFRPAAGSLMGSLTRPRRPRGPWTSAPCPRWRSSRRRSGAAARTPGSARRTPPRCPCRPGGRWPRRDRSRADRPRRTPRHPHQPAVRDATKPGGSCRCSRRAGRGVDRVPVDGDRGHGQLAVLVGQHLGLVQGHGTTLRGQREGRLGVGHPEGDVTDAVTVAELPAGDRVLGREPRREHEADRALLEHVGHAVAHAGLRVPRRRRGGSRSPCGRSAQPGGRCRRGTRSRRSRRSPSHACAWLLRDDPTGYEPVQAGGCPSGQAAGPRSAHTGGISPGGRSLRPASGDSSNSGRPIRRNSTGRSSRRCCSTSSGTSSRVTPPYQTSSGAT